jgi:cytochrome c556
MKTRFVLCSAALLLVASAGVFADEATDAYSKLMKPAAAANGAMQKNVDGDLAMAATNAKDVQMAFAKIEDFWAKRGTADAQMFAKNVQMVAADVESAAKAGNKEAASAAAKKIGANCGGCHMAHRDKLPDGSFQLK